MKQIYDFEQIKPPVLNENMLRAKMEKRKLRWQTVLIVFAAFLMQIVMILLGLVTFVEYPWIAVGCFVYVMVSIMGSSVIVIVYSGKKGGF